MRLRMRERHHGGNISFILSMILLVILTWSPALQAEDQLPGYRAPLVDSCGTPSQWRDKRGGPEHDNVATHPTEITELAEGLRYNPGDIYKMIYDYVAFEPSWGDVKGAYMTWMDRSGNAFDQAALAVALLELAATSNSELTIADPCFVVGEIQLTQEQAWDWLKMPSDANESAQVLARNGLYGTLTTDASGDVTAVNLEHVWVRVTIDDEVYEFDPSFKTYTGQGGLYNYQMEIAMGYDETDFLDDAEEGATIDAYEIEDINTANIAANLNTYSATLNNYIKAYHADGDLSDIIGGRKIVPVDVNDLPPDTLPYTVISRDEMFASDEIPDIYRSTLRVQYQGLDKTFYSSDIYGRRLALSLNIANQKQLLLDGQVEATGNVVTTGTSYELTLTVDHPYEVDVFDANVIMNVKAGGYYVINNGWGDTGTKILAKLRQDLKQLRFNDEPDGSEAVMGTSYSLVGMTWLAQTSKLRNLARWTGDVSFAHTITNHHMVGLVGEYDSPILDMPIGALGLVSHDNDHEDEPEGMFLSLTGHANAYQHAVIRQLQDVDSVSAVKLLDMANALTVNDKLFHAASTTWNSIESQLDNYSPTEKDRVEKYVDAGYSVFLPEEGNLTLDNWTGTGFYARKFDVNELTVSYVAGDGSCGGYSAATSTTLSVADLSQRCYDPPLGLNGVGLGVYTHGHTDLTIGTGSMPFGLTFSRSYSSNRHLEDGPVGLGWNHNFNIVARVTSDSFQMLGEDSAADAAAQLVTLYVAQDIKGPSSTYVSVLTEAWLADRMQDNLVILDNGGARTRFVKQPNGYYQAPMSAKLKMVEQANGNLRLKNPSGKFYDFNSDGTISQWSDQFGSVTNFNYSNGQLISVTNHIGDPNETAYWSMSFSYTGDRITTVTDSANRSVSLTYDADGQMTTSTNANGKDTTYGYDTNYKGRLTKLWNPVDAPEYPSVTVAYDSLGRIEKLTNANEVSWDHYLADYRTELLEPAQPDPNDPYLASKRFSTVAWSNTFGQPVLSIDQLGRQSSAEYNGRHRPTVVRNHFKNSRSYSYEQDPNNPDVYTIAETGSLCRPFSPHTDPNIFWGYGHDSHENDDGRWFILHETTADPCGYTTTNEYDPNYGTLLKTTGPEVGWGDANEPEVSFSYNGYGQVASKTNPEGMVTKYIYYDADKGAGLWKTIVDEGSGQSNITTVLTYNRAGQLLSVTDPKGYTTQNQYSDTGRLIKTNAPSPISTEIDYEYNDGGQPRFLKQTLEDNTVIILQEITYDKLGQVATKRGPYEEGTTDANEYNTNYTRYFYDDLGRAIKVIDAEDNETETKYYPDGKVWMSIDAKGNAVVTNTYNDDGTLAKVEDAKGNATQYEYNGFGALKKTTFADGTYTKPTYDKVRRLVKSKNRAEQEISYAYDGLHRLRTKTLPGNPYSTDIDYTYDLCGRILKVEYGPGTGEEITSTYDSAGRLIQITDGKGRTTAYEYDLNGNRTKLTYPDNSYITYEYDELNRPLKIKDNTDTALAEYEYDERLRRKKITYANGTYADYSYDTASRLLGIDHYTSNKDPNYHYSYDDVGNRLTMVVNGDTANTHTYTYDEIYQIVEVNYPAGYSYLVGDTSFSYDAVGNRSSVIDDQTVTYTSNNLNQYSTVGGVWFDYDNNGNLAYDAANFYEYDAENRLIEIRRAAGGGTGPLTAATDCDLAFTTGGDANWVDVNDVYYHHLDSARSGDIANSQSSWMETTVQGEGTITFMLKTNISSGNFYFYVDDSVKITRSGNNSWGQHTVFVNEDMGSHTLKWRYHKGSSGSEDDYVWVDKIVWTPTPITPVKTLQEALDVGWAVGQGGGSSWSRSLSVFTYDGDSACSGSVNSSGGSSIMLAEVYGEGDYSFWWKVSSEADKDYLEFYVDGELYDEDSRISGNQDWDEYPFSLTGSGRHILMWKFIRDSSGGGGSNCGWVDRLQGPDTPSQPNGMGEALDTSLEFTKGGDGYWYEYTSTYYYDNDAVESSDLDDNEQVWFQTTVELDAQETLSFWWKVSSHYSDGLEFYSGPDPNNLVRRYRISGDQNWQQKTYTLSAGTHVLKWAYIKDGWTSSGSDCGWVDLVQLGSFGPIDVRIATDDDDAEESASGSVDLGSSDLELVCDGYRGNQTVGLRFTNLAIPQGAEIGSAYIEFTADETNSGDCNLTIQAEDIDDAPAFSSSHSNLSNRTKTTAQVSWSPDYWNTTWAKHKTSDIASVIQEVIDRPGWSSGNDLVILITGTGERTAESYDGSSSKAPLLHIECASKLENDLPPTQWDKVTYKYDPCGRRIAKHIDNDYTTTYAYDGGNVLAEYNGDGNLLRKYIYGPGVDQPICMIEAAEDAAAYYYHFDGLGSVIALSDEDGNSVQTYEYSVYGQTGVDPNHPKHPNPYMFTGRRFDVETGLYYYRARYYDPHTGRFLQTDPIGYSDGINWYAYCGNNPVLCKDPTGTEQIDAPGPGDYEDLRARGISVMPTGHFIVIPANLTPSLLDNYVDVNRNIDAAILLMTTFRMIGHMEAFVETLGGTSIMPLLLHIIQEYDAQIQNYFRNTVRRSLHDMVMTTGMSSPGLYSAKAYFQVVIHHDDGSEEDYYRWIEVQGLTNWNRLLGDYGGYVNDENGIYDDYAGSRAYAMEAAYTGMLYYMSYLQGGYVPSNLVYEGWEVWDGYAYVQSQYWAPMIGDPRGRSGDHDDPRPTGGGGGPWGW